MASRAGPGTAGASRTRIVAPRGKPVQTPGSARSPCPSRGTAGPEPRKSASTASWVDTFWAAVTERSPRRAVVGESLPPQPASKRMAATHETPPTAPDRIALLYRSREPTPSTARSGTSLLRPGLRGMTTTRALDHAEGRREKASPGRRWDPRVYQIATLGGLLLYGLG